MVTGGLMRARMGGHWWSYENQRVKTIDDRHIVENCNRVFFINLDMYFDIDMSVLYKNTTHNCIKKDDPQMQDVVRAHIYIFI